MSFNDYWRGASLALCAAACWGIVGPAAKIIADGGVNLMTVAAFRALFSVLATGTFLLFKGRSSSFRPNAETLRFYFLSGLLSVACGTGGFLMSVEYLTIAEAEVVHYTYPLVAIAGSLAVTRERPTVFQVIAAAVVVMGVFIGMGGSASALAAVPWLGLFWGVLAVAGVGGQALVARRYAISHKTDEAALLLFANAFGFVLLAALKTCCFGWEDVSDVSPYAVFLMFFQATAGSVVAYAAFFTALEYLPAATVSLLCTFEVVAAVVLAAVFAGQIPTLHEIIGCALVLAAICFASISPKKN